MKTLKWSCIFLFLALSACGSTQITNSWKAETPVRQYKKIIVMAIIPERDRNLQEQMENHLVGDLQKLGYQAVSALGLYGPKTFAGLDEKTAMQKLDTDGVDAILTVVLLDKTRERYYKPGYIYYSPYGYYHGHFWYYQETLYNRIYEPGYYYASYTEYFWESNLYDMASQKLVYSVQTKSFDFVGAEALGHEYGKMIVDDMVRKQVLVDNPNK